MAVGVLACLAAACTDVSPLQPSSGGRPYELLVTGSDSTAVALVAEGMRAFVVDGLPQAEPAFDVNTIVAPGLGQATRYARNIVVVSLVSDSLLKPSITYERDAYARPQLILHVRAASVGQLRDSTADYLRTLSYQFGRHELLCGVAQLRKHHNEQAARMADSAFALRLWVPDELNKTKCGRDFLWWACETGDVVQSICVYRYASATLTAAQALRKRDSIMRQNIPGEQPGMYMQTNRRSVRGRVTRDLLELRGLWEMRGDAMGGPFVSHSFRQGDSIVTVEAFVYAPARSKRHIVRRLESSLYSAKAAKGS